jgi:hypothetical protein
VKTFVAPPTETEAAGGSPSGSPSSGSGSGGVSPPPGVPVSSGGCRFGPAAPVSVTVTLALMPLCAEQT